MSNMSNLASKYWCQRSTSEYNYLPEIEAVIHSHIDCFLINMLGPAQAIAYLIVTFNLRMNEKALLSFHFGVKMCYLKMQSN